MKEKDKKQLTYAMLVVVGIIIGYFLFSGTNPLIQNITNNTGSIITTDSTTDNGSEICTRVCVPKPTNCPRDCPPGTHYQCSGTIAMNCGCFPDVPTPTIVTDNTGERGCITNPSICGIGWYCDTGMNQCARMV